MSRLTSVRKFIVHNIYWIVVIAGVVIIGFVDENSLMQRAKNHERISELKEEIDSLNTQYENDEAELREIRHNPDAITRIAREKYFMKKDDEDIFVIRDSE